MVGDQGRNASGEVGPEQIERDHLAGRIRRVMLAMTPPIGSRFVAREMEEPAVMDLVTTERTGIEPVAPEQAYERESGQARLLPRFTKYRGGWRLVTLDRAGRNLDARLRASESGSPQRAVRPARGWADIAGWWSARWHGGPSSGG